MAKKTTKKVSVSKKKAVRASKSRLRTLVVQYPSPPPAPPKFRECTFFGDVQLEVPMALTDCEGFVWLLNAEGVLIQARRGR